MIAPSVAKLEIFRREAKFSSDKMEENSRFCELSTEELQEMLENVIPVSTKKATNFGLRFFNRTYL